MFVFSKQDTDCKSAPAGELNGKLNKRQLLVVSLLIMALTLQDLKIYLLPKELQKK